MEGVADKHAYADEDDALDRADEVKLRAQSVSQRARPASLAAPSGGGAAGPISPARISGEMVVPISQHNGYMEPVELNPALGEEANRELVHQRLQHLCKEEDDLLGACETPAERAEVKETYFHQKMSLLMQLPPEEQKKYHSKTIMRLGVSRENINMEADVVHKTYACFAILFINCLLFLLSMWQSNWEFAPLSTNPFLGPSQTALENMGAKNTTKIKNDKQWWRLIIPIFLHAGIFHLLMNMLVLMRLGRSMEEAFGSLRVATIYVCSGVTGNMASAIFLPASSVVGASGSLFGLIGALFGDFVQNHKFMQEGKWSYFASLVVSSIVGLLIGLLPLVDNFVHLFGWLSGILLGTVLLAGVVKDAAGRSLKVWYSNYVAVTCLILFAVLWIIAIALLSSQIDGSSWCSWCANVSCLNTPWWTCDRG